MSVTARAGSEASYGSADRGSEGICLPNPIGRPGQPTAADLGSEAYVYQPAYYMPYHGHETAHLEVVLQALRQKHGSVVFFAGDSSLDNKYWFRRQADAVNGYEDVLRPPIMKTDVCYWLNREFVQHGAAEYCCINTAVEATSLNNRAFCHLLEQDRFIQDNIAGDDVLVVSIGGNDIALQPVLLTIVNLLLLTWIVPQACIERCSCACPPNLHVDGGCFCCGLPGCISGTLCGWPPGLGYFVDLFKNRVQDYIARLVAKRKPKKVLVCMIYFLDEARTGGWADGALRCMRYDANPSKLQAAIRAMFHLATSRIEIPGTEVVPVPLFEALDGKTSSDYLDRVEPSPEGGRKMAALLAKHVLSDTRGAGSAAALSSAPASSRMEPWHSEGPPAGSARLGAAAQHED